MKHRFAYLLLLFLLLQLCGQAVVYLYYTLNKEYITENLCENKKKQELLCSGKCYLNKLLIITDSNTETDQPQPYNLSLEKKQPLALFYTKPNHTFDYTLCSQILEERIDFEYISLYSHQVIFSIFRPPCS